MGVLLILVYRSTPGTGGRTTDIEKPPGNGRSTFGITRNSSSTSIVLAIIVGELLSVHWACFLFRNMPTQRLLQVYGVRFLILVDFPSTKRTVV